MKKIKILYGLEASGGGALKHLVYLVTHLNREIFDITIILSNKRNENISEEVYRMKLAGAKLEIIPMKRGIIPISDLVSFIKIYLFVRNKNFDIVHAHSSKAGALFRFVSWICHVPTVLYTPHCFYFQGKNGLKKNIFLLLEKLLSKLTTGIILSENEKEQAIKHQIIDTSKLYNINNAIDFNEYKLYDDKEALKSEFKIPNDSLIIGAIGRLEEQKGWDRFFEIAFEILEINIQTCFIIAGDGELKNDLAKRIPYKYTDKFKFLGFVKDINKVYIISDAIFSTSIYEGLPYVYIEAITLNKKLITTCYIKDLEEFRNKEYFPINGNTSRDIALELLKVINLPSYPNEENIVLEDKFLDMALFIKKHQDLYLKMYHNIF